jgi:hypothetical protein
MRESLRGMYAFFRPPKLKAVAVVTDISHEKVIFEGDPDEAAKVMNAECAEGRTLRCYTYWVKIPT